MFRVALRLLLAAALGAVPATVRADVYRWVDDTGETHYATTIDAVPRSYRGAAEVIKPPATGIVNPSSARPPAPPTPPPRAVEPTPAPAPAPVEPPAPATSAPSAPVTPPSAPDAQIPESQSPAPVPPPMVAAPAPPPAEHEPGDPRETEIAQLEGQIERDREQLRQLISTPRWDSAELASDPRVREIAERLPRLQAELSALRTEAGR